MRDILFVFLFALLLAGCVGSPPRPADIAVYDFGGRVDAGSPGGVPLSAITVRASSALAAAVQRYRLDYADGLRRQAYAASRWAAPPAELLENFLRRRLGLGSPTSAGLGCRLTLDLMEFEQRFMTAQQSEQVLEVQVVLLLPSYDAVPLARRAFRIAAPAPTPDARGGAQAARTAAQSLADALAQWLGEVAGSNPSLSICKEKK